MNEDIIDINIFDRKDPSWRRVSRKFAIVDLILNVFFSLLVTAIAFFVSSQADEDNKLVIFLIITAVSLIFLINALFSFRRVRAIGYVLLKDELVFRRGIMFERIISVPYGRLQIVDVTRGPLLRSLGLATLKFVTASGATGVNLPGLKLAEAETLRDQLVDLAETRRSGL